MFNINGENWRVVLTSPNHPCLFRSDGSLTIGSCDDSAKTIYLNETLEPHLMRKVLCHEVAHAAMFSYNVELSLDQEELLADLIATYGQEIIAKTNLIFNRLRGNLGSLSFFCSFLSLITMFHVGPITELFYIILGIFLFKMLKFFFKSPACFTVFIGIIAGIIFDGTNLRFRFIAIVVIHIYFFLLKVSRTKSEFIDNGVFGIHLLGCSSGKNLSADTKSPFETNEIQYTSSQ